MSEQKKTEYFQLRAQGFSHGEAYAAIYGAATPPPTSPPPTSRPPLPAPFAAALARLDAKHTPLRIKTGAVFPVDQMRSFTLADFETMRTLAPDTYRSCFGALNVDPWVTPRLGFSPTREQLDAIRALGPDARNARVMKDVAKQFGRTVSSVSNLHRKMFMGEKR